MPRHSNHSANCRNTLNKPLSQLRYIVVVVVCIVVAAAGAVLDKRLHAKLICVAAVLLSMYASTVYMYMRYTNAITLSSLSRGCCLPPSPSPPSPLPAQITSNFGGEGAAWEFWRPLESATQHLRTRITQSLYVPPPPFTSSANLSAAHSALLSWAIQILFAQLKKPKAVACHCFRIPFLLSPSHAFPCLPFHSLLTFPTAMQIFRCNWECLTKVFFLTTLTLLWGKQAGRQFVIRTHMFIGLTNVLKIRLYIFLAC